MEMVDPLTPMCAILADAGVLQDPHHEVRGGPGQLDDLVLRQARHGRARDRACEPVPRVDKFGLSLLVRLEGQGQSIRSHARSMPFAAIVSWAACVASRAAAAAGCDAHIAVIHPGGGRRPMSVAELVLDRFSYLRRRVPWPP